MVLARMQPRPIRDPVKLMTRLTCFVGNVRARYEVFTRYDRRASPTRVDTREEPLKAVRFVREEQRVSRAEAPPLESNPVKDQVRYISLSRNSNDETCIYVCICVCVFCTSK